MTHDQDEHEKHDGHRTAAAHATHAPRAADADDGTGDPHSPEAVAASLLASISLLKRRLRHRPAEGGELSVPERTALSRLNRIGPATSSDLARTEQISPQAMGATLRALEAGGLVERRADPEDGRRKVLTVSAAGARLLREKRGALTELMTQVLAEGFGPDELAQLAAAAPLLTRLAQGI